MKTTSIRNGKSFQCKEKQWQVIIGILILFSSTIANMIYKLSYQMKLNKIMIHLSKSAGIIVKYAKDHFSANITFLSYFHSLLDDQMTEIRIYRKSDYLNLITIYITKREFYLLDGSDTQIEAVITVQKNALKENVKVYAELCISFRYGRDDEEVLGIPFVTEETYRSIQLHPCFEQTSVVLSNFQKAVTKKCPESSYPIMFTVAPNAPPSVHLYPSKQYNGEPVGITYYIRAVIEPTALIENVKYTFAQFSLQLKKLHSYPEFPVSLKKSQEKHFSLFDGKVVAEGFLDKELFQRDEDMQVEVRINNESNKYIKCLKIFVVQFTDVTMFRKGKFKNIVAMADTKNDSYISPHTVFLKKYALKFGIFEKKRWVAVEDYSKEEKRSKLCCTIESTNCCLCKISPINVSYYIKIKISLGYIGGKISLKLPFKMIETSDSDCSKEQLNSAP